NSGSRQGTAVAALFVRPAEGTADCFHGEDAERGVGAARLGRETLRTDATGHHRRRPGGLLPKDAQATLDRTMARALSPNSTQVPDIILDQWMAMLTGAEFKVLLYIARRTYGFGKEADNISLNQLASGIRRRDGTILDRGTGLSRSGVKGACNS